MGGKRADVKFFPDFNVNAHIAVQVRHSQSVNARNGRNDDNVAPFHKTVRRGKTQFVDFLVDCRVFFDVEVPRRNVGFRLVIIIVGNKIFDGVVREKSLKLAVELGGKRFVVADDERRTLYALNDFCHRKRFSASGNAFERLVAVAAQKSFRQFFDCLSLIACRLIGRNDGKLSHNALKLPRAGTARRLRRTFF